MKTLRPLLLLLFAFPSLLPAQTPVGDEIRVATAVSGLSNPDVAMSPQGTFAVGWIRNLAGDRMAVFARLYGADGSPRTGEIRISGNLPASPVSFLRAVRLAMMHDGSFVAVYLRGAQTLVARRFAADGTPLGNPLLITANEVIAFFEIGSRGDGSFVAVWQENFNRVIAQVFGPGNEPPGPKIEVWAGTPRLPRVAVRPDGSFLVVWADIQGSSGTGHFEELLARVFTAGGAPLGESFSVAGEPEISFNIHDTAVDVNGNFLVTWLLGLRPSSTFVRRFAPDGAPLGPPSFAGSRPAGIEIAQAPAGGFVSVWKGNSLLTDVVARQFSASGSPRGPMVPLSQRARAIGDSLRLAASGTGSFVAVWDWHGRTGRDTFGSVISVRRFRVD